LNSIHENAYAASKATPTEMIVAGTVMRTELRKKCERLSPPLAEPSTLL
jgi:hypothetical protein